LEDTGPSRLSVGRTALVLTLLVLFSATLRVQIARHDANFSSSPVEGLLKSDPALVHYVTSRIVENGGTTPPELRADPLVEHPAGLDLPGALTIGQEHLIAWAHGLLGGETPLHEVALILMALTAACTLLGVYGIAREWGGSRRWGLFAALLWSLVPAAYRSAGSLFLREDLAFPLLAGFLWALLRCRRTGARSDHLMAGVLLGLSLATWHASAHFALLTAGCLLLSLLLGAERPLRAQTGLLLPFTAALIVALFPVGRARLLFLTPALCAFTAAALANRPGLDRTRRMVEAIAVLLIGVAGSFLLGGGLLEDAHVHELLFAKITHLGQRPIDPTALSFDARLLWQGPFETTQLISGALLLGVSLLALITAFRQGTLSTFARCLLITSAAAAWLVTRVLILPAALLPAAAAVWMSRHQRGRLLATTLLLTQAGLFAHHLKAQELSWYKPPGRQAELAGMIAAISEHVPPGEAVASDFMNSPAILTHTRRPILVQPKYELDSSRRAAESFLTGFFHTDAAAFRRELLTDHECRYLLVDRFTLGFLSPYTAGLRRGEAPDSNTPAASLLSQDDTTLESLPGYELLWRSPDTILQRDGSPYDLYRLYRLTAD